MVEAYTVWAPGPRWAHFLTITPSAWIYFMGKEEVPTMFVSLSLSGVKGSPVILQTENCCIRNSPFHQMTLSKGNNPCEAVKCGWGCHLVVERDSDAGNLGHTLLGLPCWYSFLHKYLRMPICARQPCCNSSINSIVLKWEFFSWVQIKTSTGNVRK